MAKKSVKATKKGPQGKTHATNMDASIFEVLCQIRGYQHTAATMIVDLRNGLAAQHEVYNGRLLELLQTLQGQPQQAKVDLLKELVDSQKKLAEVIMLLTAKGVAKAREKKEPAPAAAPAAQPPARENGAALSDEKKVAADVAERAAREKDPPVEPKKPDLKVVPDQKPEAQAALTVDSLKAQFLAFVSRKGRDAAVKLLEDYGAKNVAGVPPSQFAAFAEACAK